MGAVFFTHAGLNPDGKHIAEVFDDCVSDAAYDYGHAGYTGTIAEKSGFILVDEVAETWEEAEDMADTLTEEKGYGEDKWGPAAALHVRDQGWLFFGYAST